MSGRKTVCGFSIILIFKEIITFESQRGQAFCRTKYKLLKNETESKTENSTHSFRETNLALHFT